MILTKMLNQDAGESSRLFPNWEPLAIALSDSLGRVLKGELLLNPRDQSFAVMLLQ